MTSLHNSNNPTDDELLRRIGDGESAAERLLFDRYYWRLVSYARTGMNGRLQQVEPASDLAQSAMKSVLLGIPAQEFSQSSREFPLSSNESLWPLLVSVTLNKIRNRGRKHGGPSRRIALKVPLTDYQILVAGNDQQAECEISDLVERLLGSFSNRRRQVLEMLLDGFKAVEIARELKMSKRTVYNTRQQAATCLRELLDNAAD